MHMRPAAEELDLSLALALTGCGTLHKSPVQHLDAAVRLKQGNKRTGAPWINTIFIQGY